LAEPPPDGFAVVAEPPAAVVALPAPDELESSPQATSPTVETATVATSRERERRVRMTAFPSTLWVPIRPQPMGTPGARGRHARLSA
jgi:hypothetical protein